jgi:hypothetical protein
MSDQRCDQMKQAVVEAEVEDAGRTASTVTVRLRPLQRRPALREAAR